MASRHLSKRAEAAVDRTGLHLTLQFPEGLRTLDFSLREAYLLYDLLESHITLIEQSYQERLIERQAESEQPS